MTAPVPLDYASLDDLAAWAAGVMADRAPDFVIGEPERPYMRRWFVVPRNPFANIYLHEILRSDDDRALHDHPWSSRSLIIEGGYYEHLPLRGKFPYPDEGTVRYWRGPGWVGDRTADQAHRLELPEGGRAVTLFFTGAKEREWGFHCPQGWRHWQAFTGGENGEVIGPGCD